eukprot:CAMPEP_0185024842 /NCGR_PEP_ID=MMETSP1103-20130426/8032_1 /TAXON_ID=36769 /ORGANISM="Paraphysomonas bandaiensis, Strain Caron Lab Isolate" /LENGTH=211 /DNA_ID=CAMNT_0027557911 /DNA_START=45 /DNA_END=681 /DNA_ORIENTATION=+
MNTPPPKSASSSAQSTPSRTQTQSGGSKHSTPGRSSNDRAEGEPLERLYSEKSDAALKKLDEQDGYFHSFANRVENIERSLDMRNPATLVHAKHELAQIIGDLEKLQFNEVDSVETHGLDSGKSEASAHRKDLNAKINEMMEQTQLLYQQIDSTLTKINQTRKEESKEEEPLRRDEIAKLLLLSAVPTLSNRYLWNNGGLLKTKYVAEMVA